MNYHYNLRAIALRVIALIILFTLPILINAQQMMRTNLLIESADGTATLMDGNLTNYDPVYSNDVDMHDAWKMNNFGENLGIYRNGHTLVVERRKPVIDKDTTFLKMWNLQQRNYRLQIVTKNFEQLWLTAVLKDNYLLHQTKIDLNDTTNFSFTINTDPASFDPKRFEIIFAKDVTADLPVSFIDFKAWRNAQAVQINWNILNEVAVHNYIVEHSIDGRTFGPLQTIDATNNGYKSYSAIHINAPAGENFYRIKAFRETGNYEFSLIAKVSAVNTPLSIYPNPIANRIFNLKADGKEPGTYSLTLIGTNGISYPLKSLKVFNGQSEQVELPSHVVSGIYRLKISRPGNPDEIITVYIL